MKILLLCLLLCAVAANAATTNKLFLTWDNDPDWDTNVSFYVYSQTNVALPFSGWMVATNISYAQWLSTPGGAAVLPRSMDRVRFYVVTASNIWGESDFSEAVSVRRTQPPAKVRIGVSSSGSP